MKRLTVIGGGPGGYTAAFAAARVADDGAELTAPQGNLVKRFGFSGLIAAGEKGEGLHRLSL